MLAFSTEFPVYHAHTAAAFLRAIEVWILGSPHTELVANDLTPLSHTTECSIRKLTERIDMLRVDAGAGNTEHAGIKYFKRDGDLEWVTSVVFARTATDSWVALRLLCESSLPTTRLPQAKKPVVVRTLLTELGGAADGILRVGESAHRLENVDIDIAARLISGGAGCRLPIVYVSAGFQGSYTLDADRLARELAGMAHVVVEPNRAFSLRLKMEVESANVYGGTVGVYWPEGGGRRSFFLGRDLGSHDVVAQAVLDEVRNALTNRRGLERCSWATLQESASRRAIDGLRAAGSKQVDDYIAEFDREIAAKDQRLEDAEREITRLNADLRILEARLPLGGVGLIKSGEEQDLYPMEQLCILRLVLQDALSRVPADSRREHVLKAVLAANPVFEDATSSNRERLKRVLRGSKGLDRGSRRELESMGFAIQEEGKHYKLIFQEDDRYTFTLPKSGSDYRGGLNAASDIGRFLF